MWNLCVCVVPCLIIGVIGLMARPDSLCGCWGFEHGSACFHSRCSYPQSHLPSLLTFFIAIL